MVALKTAEGRITLDGNIFKEYKARDVTVQEPAPAQMRTAYARFGLTL